MKTILISNDDGVDSRGIKALAVAMKKIRGARIIVVAPDRQQSATSHSLTLHRPLRVKKVKAGFYAVDGTPTDCVMLAVHKILKIKPDLVVSGINHGANLGEDVHYSGTVAAAVEGAIMGVPSIAVSVVGDGKYRFDVAASIAVRLSRQVLKKGLPPGLVLNVNVPNRGKIRGYEFTRLGRHHYSDVIVEKADPRGRPYFWIGGDPRKYVTLKNSDCNAYLENRISITPLQIDLTDTKFLKKMRTWKL